MRATFSVEDREREKIGHAICRQAPIERTVLAVQLSTGKGKLQIFPRPIQTLLLAARIIVRADANTMPAADIYSSSGARHRVDGIQEQQVIRPNHVYIIYIHNSNNNNTRFKSSYIPVIPVMSNMFSR